VRIPATELREGNTLASGTRVESVVVGERTVFVRTNRDVHLYLTVGDTVEVMGENDIPRPHPGWGMTFT
jgi:hypothetical protein